MCRDPLVIFEVTKSNAWTEGEANFVIEEAQKRLREQGWGAVRPALSTTIRSVFPGDVSVYILMIASC